MLAVANLAFSFTRVGYYQKSQNWYSYRTFSLFSQNISAKGEVCISRRQSSVTPPPEARRLLQLRIMLSRLALLPQAHRQLHALRHLMLLFPRPTSLYQHLRSKHFVVCCEDLPLPRLLVCYYARVLLHPPQSQRVLELRPGRLERQRGTALLPGHIVAISTRMVATTLSRRWRRRRRSLALLGLADLFREGVPVLERDVRYVGEEGIARPRRLGIHPFVTE
mmetsp:Transcript_8751/g.15843  ORF Transcript_8751/g.15843 Transcript_8751/m.15843 type:complete len:222 (+) Transcript_8751:42-707(+)